MSVSDPIADFLTILRNASKARKEKITVKSSKMIVAICGILKSENYIDDYRAVKEGNKNYLRVHLKYEKDQAEVIKYIGRVSRPGLREYMGANQIPKVLGGLGLMILTTPKGLLSGKDARKQNVGGEVLLKVW